MLFYLFRSVVLPFTLALLCATAYAQIGIKPDEDLRAAGYLGYTGRINVINKELMVKDIEGLTKWARMAFEEMKMVHEGGGFAMPTTMVAVHRLNLDSGVHEIIFGSSIKNIKSMRSGRGAKDLDWLTDLGEQVSKSNQVPIATLADEILRCQAENGGGPHKYQTRCGEFSAFQQWINVHHEAPEGRSMMSAAVGITGVNALVEFKEPCVLITVATRPNSATWACQQFSEMSNLMPSLLPPDKKRVAFPSAPRKGVDFTTESRISLIPMAQHDKKLAAMGTLESQSRGRSPVRSARKDAPERHKSLQGSKSPGGVESTVWSKSPKEDKSSEKVRLPGISRARSPSTGTGRAAAGPHRAR